MRQSARSERFPRLADIDLENGVDPKGLDDVKHPLPG
jgi:hypothetical protein